jgi:hypothetical protein
MSEEQGWQSTHRIVSDTRAPIEHLVTITADATAQAEIVRRGPEGSPAEAAGS